MSEQNTTNSGPQAEDVHWKCGNCGRITSAQTPPDVCPGCNEKCDFKNVSCYTPECGGPGNIDPRL
jgi:rubrerythrin